MKSYHNIRSSRSSVKNIQIIQGGQDLTAQAGLIPVVKFLKKHGFASKIEQTLDHQRGATGVYDAVDMILLPLVAIVGGARSISSIVTVWNDHVLYRATAIEMNKYGAKVIAMARTQSDLDSLNSDIGCVTIKVDISDNVAARVAMQKAGTCEFLINNAGTNVLESVLVTEEGYEAVMGEPLRADLDLRPGIFQRSCGLWRWWFDRGFSIDRTI